jgi:hypothetical protein
MKVKLLLKVLKQNLFHTMVKLLNNISINTAVKKESKTDWVVGHVKININENVTINSYTKRIKIFNNGKWIDT